MDDTTLDAIEGQARFSALTGDGVAPARSVIALVAEVRRLTAEAATQREWFEAADAAAERRLDQSIAWMERAESAEAEVVTLRAQVNGLHEELLRGDPDVGTLRARLAAVEALHVRVERQFTRDSCNYCGGDQWPCPTIAALAVTTGEGQ